MALEFKAEPPQPGDIYDHEGEQAALGRILDRWYGRILHAVNALVGHAFDLGRDFIVDDATTTRVLQHAATRVVRIDETTRQAVSATLQEGQARGYSNWQIAHGVPAEGYRGVDGLFQETWRGRADMVARTELQHAQLVSAVERYRASGLIDRVRIIDGCQWDKPCCDRNDTIVPLEQAGSITLNHPNCTVTIVPVLREDVG